VKRTALGAGAAAGQLARPYHRSAAARRPATPGDLQARAAAALGYRVSLRRERWRGLAQALNSVSPLAVLARGYAVVTLADGTVVRRAGQVAGRDELRVRVSEGNSER